MLISLLSAWHEGEWTLADVQPTLRMLFDRQYTLTENVVKERRYYIETDTWTDEDGNTHTDSYRAYMRRMALCGYVLQIDLAPVRELVSLQRRCSNNLNQVAIHANTYGGIYPEEISALQRDYSALWGPLSDLLKQLSALVEL